MKSALGTIVAITACLVFTSSADGRPRRQRPPRETSAASRSSAFPEDQACLSVFRGAEASEQAGRLRAAKERLFLCAQPLCARAIRHECALRSSRIDADIPSVVLVVQDQSGTPESDVQVAVDGEPLTSHLDGRALPVDPGLRRFTFSKSGEVIARQSVMIAQGQHNRLIAVSWKATDAPVAAATPALPAARTVMLTSIRPSSANLERASAKAGSTAVPERADTNRSPAPPALSLASMTEGVASPPQRPRPRRIHHALAAEHPGTGSSSPPLSTQVSTPDADDGRSGMKTLTVALGGVGVASLLSGTLLILWARADNKRLSECSPVCSEAAVSHVHNMYLGGNVAFGVGIAALAGATWASLRSRALAEPRGTDTAYHLELQPSRTGALALVRGTF
jgi:hypothetical protein